MDAVEQVLVIERSAFDRAGPFEGISFDCRRYLDAIFAEGVPRFMPRPEAEDSPAYKQIIPYVIITDGSQFVSYVRGRRAGEQRLVGHRSIGIGGHVNPADDMPLFGGDYRETYRAAVEREVAEEVAVGGEHTDRIAALISDDSTEVGRVHLGIVHVWRVGELTVSKREQMITQLSVMTAAELRANREQMESWSRFCVDELERIMQSSGAEHGPTNPERPLSRKR
jgi:predicted NUDIX family phosphoesterase